MIFIKLLVVGSLLILGGLIAVVRVTSRESSGSSVPSAERGSGTIGSVKRSTEIATTESTDDTTGEDDVDGGDVRTNADRDLTDVSGVMSADAAALRAAGFESVTDLERASTEELQAVDDIDQQAALRIKADVGG